MTDETFERDVRAFMTEVRSDVTGLKAAITEIKGDAASFRQVVVEAFEAQGRVLASQGQALESIIRTQNRHSNDLREIIARLNSMAGRLDDIENRLDDPPSAQRRRL